jgi:hypothetical protein
MDVWVYILHLQIWLVRRLLIAFIDVVVDVAIASKAAILAAW